MAFFVFDFGVSSLKQIIWNKGTLIIAGLLRNLAEGADGMPELEPEISRGSRTPENVPTTFYDPKPVNPEPYTLSLSLHGGEEGRRDQATQLPCWSVFGCPFDRRLGSFSEVWV